MATFLNFATKTRLQSTLFWADSILPTTPNEPVRNLGAMFDSLLIMAPHVKSVVKKSSFHLRNIGKARRVLTEDATKTVMQSLVMSRLDYCNALLIGIQQDLIAKLQRLQNSAARIVSRTRKYEHITPVLIKLHWLPIKFRIQFKIMECATTTPEGFYILSGLQEVSQNTPFQARPLRRCGL